MNCKLVCMVRSKIFIARMLESLQTVKCNYFTLCYIILHSLTIQTFSRVMFNKCLILQDYFGVREMFTVSDLFKARVSLTLYSTLH